MRRVFQLLPVLAVALTPIILRAQSDGAQQIDEFGKLNSETAMVRLQSAMIQLAEHLEKHPNAMLQFVVFRGRNQRIGAPYYTFATFKATYAALHFDTSRIISTVCDYRPEQITQIWLIDSLAEQHPCAPHELRLNATTLFVTSYAPNEELALGGCCTIDEVGYAATIETVKSYAAFVTSRPGTRAYAVVYGGTNMYGFGDSRGRMRSVRNLDPRSFIDKLRKDVRKQLLAAGLDVARIVLLNGGYRDSTASVDLWIVPPGGKRPTPTPNFLRRKKRCSTSPSALH